MRKEMTRKNMNTFVIAIRSRVTDRWLRVLVNKETGNAYLRYEDEVTNVDVLWSVHEGHARKLRQKFEAGEGFDMTPPRTVIGGVVLDIADEPEQNPPAAAGVALIPSGVLVKDEPEPWTDPESESYLGAGVQWKGSPDEQESNTKASTTGLADVSSAETETQTKARELAQIVEDDINKTIAAAKQSTGIEDLLMVAAMSMTGFNETAIYALELASRMPRYQHMAPHLLSLLQHHLAGGFKTGAMLAIDIRGTVTQYHMDNLPIIGDFLAQGRYGVRILDDENKLREEMTPHDFAVSQLPIIGVMEQAIRHEAELLVLISIVVPSRDAVQNGMVTIALPSGGEMMLPIDAYKRMNPGVDMDKPDVVTLIRAIRRFDELADAIDWMVMSIPEKARQQREVLKQHIGAFVTDMYAVVAVTPAQATEANPFAFMADVGTA